jgi:hypothetical protein
VSEPTDIKALDEYLKGDSDVSRRYRELGHEEVPPELERRVLAAARDAVANEGTQRSRSWLRWSAPVALAASVVLVVTVVLERGPDQLAQVPAQAPAEPQVRGMIGDQDDSAAAERKLAEEVTRQRAARDQESAPVYVQPVTQAPPPALADVPPMPELAPAAATSAKAEARPIVPPPELVLEQQAEQTVAAAVAPVPEAPAAQPTPTQTAEASAGESVALNKEEADAATSVEEVSITGARTRRGPGRTAGPRGTISSTTSSRGAAAAASRPVSDDEQAARADRSDPAAWLEEIRDLRRAGRSADADREWDLFHEAFPDFYVADDDLARRKP